MSVPNTNVLSDRGSGMVTLNAPAINTGGRDAAALKPSSVQSSSSALDLIKKKLQDSGAPLASSSTPVPSVGPETNGSKAADSTAKGLQIDNDKDKQKDANGDANVSDTSSDSEDEDSGPSKEERIVQFKVYLLLCLS